MLSLSDFIETELLKLGITPEYVGYRYTATAILKCIQNEELLYAITTKLYKEIADELGTMPASVERGIRSAVAMLWAENGEERLLQLMGRRYASPPSNGKFIGVLSRRLLFRYRSLVERATAKASSE